MTALRSDPELRRVFRESLLVEMRDQLRRPIARVLGDDDPDLDLRVDIAPSFLIRLHSASPLSSGVASVAFRGGGR